MGFHSMENIPGEHGPPPFGGMWTWVRDSHSQSLGINSISGFTDLPFRDSVIQGQSDKSIHLVIWLTQEFESCALARKNLLE